MIEKMHEKTNSFAFKAIFAFVALSFVLGGVGGSLMYSKDDYVAKVNGESISKQTFTYTKNRQQSIQSDKLGAKFWDLLDTPEYAKQFNQQVLDGLISDELLKQYITTLNLGVSAEQIKKQIVNTPDFQQDGKFNNEFYQNILRNNNISPDYYASMVAGDILNAQVQQGILGSQFSVPAENKLLAKLLLQKRIIRTAVLPLNAEIAKQTVSEQEQQDYYNEHKAQFVEPEKMQVEIVTVTPEDLMDPDAVTAQDIEDYYQQNRDKFITKGETHLAHIQVVDKKTADEIEQKLNAGDDFAKLAKEYSKDMISAEKGGDLGWAKAGTFPDIFEQVANVLEVGKPSKAVEIDGNYHIIKVLDRKADVAMTLKQAEKQIKQTLIKNTSLASYGKITNEMANKAFESPDSLADVAKVANVEVQITDEFSQNALPALLDNPKIQSVLMKGDFRRSHQVSEAIDLTDGNKAKTAFIRVISYKEARPQSFEEAKDSVEKMIKVAKAEKSLTENAQQIVTALNEGQEAEITFGEPQTLVYVEDLMTLPQLTKDVFAMQRPTDKTTYQVTRDQAGNAIIITLDKVVDGKEEDFKAFEAVLLRSNQLQLRDEMLNDLRNRASIEYNDSFLRQQEP
ncbi:SurA N-terminal domain-containing protein [Phocoenobacter skyensis]|uniref:Periplasmic chaperone PpiD n=1 Tax=Phocoenobacter skyensis TaxID=97481 RepID=A0A1H7WDA7_9PAST|nr:SurA N-terminal domain-containing protein [Pasteurella skyensis]MDP8079183.1 SurA N-terminal domain-containing protein [Pasteurella skyensis]MDP8085207.1 SurA N-terminal domain-containing protein [Pasteurella skyensis]MDP8162171.1 SurA N-terminal domain-containing protein [Pasteurella skyensis]MDP8173030.1 SurA N-terminal domain-containing protein [Pasteurella skyensis]MDP8179445.1 SurA N-terminal domain-containing protein [Pasteurella skyensis]